MPNRIETRLVGPRNAREEKVLVLEYAISFSSLADQPAERIAKRIHDGMVFFIRDAQAHGLLPYAVERPVPSVPKSFNMKAATKAAKTITKKRR